MTRPTGTAGVLTRIPADARGIIALLIVLEFVAGLLQGFYDPLVKLFAQAYEVSDGHIIWFHTLQGLSAAVTVPLLAKFGDMFGHRRILRIAVGIVIASTLLTALAPDFPLLLAARILAGPIAVWLPLEIALVHQRVDHATARRVIGWLVSVLVLGAVIGNILGGLSVTLVPFSVALYVPVILMIGAVVAVLRIPETTLRAAPGIDGWGLFGIAVSMVLLLTGMSRLADDGLGAPLPWILIATALVSFTVWAWWERRSSNPAVDLRMLASPRLAPLYIVGFLFGFVLFGFQTPLATFAASDPVSDGYGLGFPTFMLSLVIAIFTIITAAGSAIVNTLTRWIGTKTVLVTAALISAAGFIFFAVQHSEKWHIFVLAVLAGIGMGLLMGALPALVAEEAPADSTGIAAGVYNSLRTLGGALSGAGFSIVLITLANPGGGASDVGYTVIWFTAASAFLIAAVVLAVSKTVSVPESILLPTPTGTMPVHNPIERESRHEHP
ncbi:MFS family permease [Microbacterium natoriense]|uniref:MFS family permease n=1 Tax=Microbacterium natoriense TaxID=284570 RepID=A0AAW8EWJ9_9MICO|nr:MFS transporter [Microbacterium natoriense]MDQ0646591.1 MFS family permease [Microbacterium natoriense]